MEQQKVSGQLHAGRNRRKWVPIGAVVGLAAGLAIGEFQLHQTFPAAAFGLALGAVIGAFFDRRAT